MDTDSLPSAPIFAAFLLLFSYLSLAHHSRAPGDGFSSARKPVRWMGPTISWLRHACVIAVALSGLDLVQSTSNIGWWLGSFLALALLVLLVIIDHLTDLAAAHHPGWATFWDRFLARAVPGRTEGGPNDRVNGGGGDGGEGYPAGDTFPDRREPAITHAELVSLDPRDREMFRSILRLDVTTAREIMVPRLDMIAVDAASSLTQVSEKMIQSGHSRLPVYEETIDRILGIVYARDVLAVLAGRHSEQNLLDLVRPAFIIPETKRLDDLLEELQDKGIQMALVVDEYGGTEGLLTMEDVLEEIVGEIEDEFSRTRESLVVRLPDGAALVDAGVTTENVEELFDTRIDSADVDTVGGFVYLSLGKIPQVGDVVITDHLRIEVVSILGRRLRKLRIVRTDDNGPDSLS